MFAIVRGEMPAVKALKLQLFQVAAVRYKHTSRMFSFQWYSQVPENIAVISTADLRYERGEKEMVSARAALFS